MTKKTIHSLISANSILLLIINLSLPAKSEQTDSKQQQSPGSSITKSEKVIEKTEYNEFFKKYAVEGSFLMFDSLNRTFTAVNYECTLKRFTPASTFKIPNSLIFLETGVVTDQNTPVIKWNGTKYDYSGWSEDQTLRSAIKSSVVWYFQENARKVGKERMQKYVNLLDYGNKDISKGVDVFWLEEGLKISQMEQINFLRKFYSYSLPVQKRNIDIVKEIIELEKTENYRLCGKTGLAVRISQKIGWLIGYVETKGNVYFFATNIEQKDSSDAFGAARKEITMSILKALGIIVEGK
ncbi:MAG TPA: class D beta-lactamase [Chitinispirillaceae bacterium]|nr:class D beta-lactamase [Chitinispirillaceae bacterium]